MIVMKTRTFYTLTVMLLFAVSTFAQSRTFEDDIYFSSKTVKAEKVEPVKITEPASTQHTTPVVVATMSSDRDVDEYNRRYFADSYIDEAVTDTIVEYIDGEYVDGE